MAYDQNHITFLIKLFMRVWVGRWHQDVLLVLLRIMKVLLETDEKTEC